MTSPFDERGLPRGYAFKPEFEIEPARLRGLLEESWLLLDVRTEEEVRLARVEPSMHIPLAELAERAVELPEDRPVITLCHHGVRSLRAALFLRERGLRAFSLAGGIDLWSLAIDPGVPRYVRGAGGFIRVG